MERPSLEGKLKRSLLLILQEYVKLKRTEEGEGVSVKAGCPSLRPGWNSPRLSADALTLGPQMADARQFFTGKLYVPVHMLKLPAEELLWSALPRMTRDEEAEKKAEEEVFLTLSQTGQCL